MSVISSLPGISEAQLTPTSWSWEQFCGEVLDLSQSRILVSLPAHWRPVRAVAPEPPPTIVKLAPARWDKIFCLVSTDKIVRI